MNNETARRSRQWPSKLEQTLRIRFGRNTKPKKLVGPEGGSAEHRSRASHGRGSRRSPIVPRTDKQPGEGDGPARVPFIQTQMAEVALRLRANNNPLPR